MKNLKKINTVLFVIAGIAGFAFIGLSIFGSTLFEETSNSTIEKVAEDKTSLPTNHSNDVQYLNSFLENPIDLQTFKKKSDRQYITTSVYGASNYHVKPKGKNGIFYSYDFSRKTKNGHNINSIIVFKKGEQHHLFNDDDETIIELNIVFQDANLKEANLVGLSKEVLITKFGEHFRKVGNHLVFSNQNKILLLEISNGVVKKYKYVSLNTSVINEDLIQKLIK